jgi:hypothetical protein
MLHLLPNLPANQLAIQAFTLKEFGTGKVTSIAHGGEPAPGGGTFRGAFSPVLNDSGAVVFQGDLSLGNPSAMFQELGVYLYSKGSTIAVARPGDPMPGGGHFVTASFITAEKCAHKQCWRSRL